MYYNWSQRYMYMYMYQKMKIEEQYVPLSLAGAYMYTCSA